MKCNAIPVRVKKEFNNPVLREILPVGFETKVYPVLGDEDFTYTVTFKNGRGETNTETITIPKGRYLGSVFTGTNGEEYCDMWLYHNIGPCDLSEVFEKI
jgi:hypothetical protein